MRRFPAMRSTSRRDAFPQRDPYCSFFPIRLALRRGVATRPFPAPHVYRIPAQILVIR